MLATQLPNNRHTTGGTDDRTVVELDCNEVNFPTMWLDRTLH
jgi:hypothetical protein